MSHFVDRARIEVWAGDGGNGLASFRREKFIPKGGPAGGDGGNGGSVIFVADHNLGTLLDLKRQRHHKADSGRSGMRNNKHGKAGDDLLIKIPLGTMVFDEETNEKLCDLSEDGEKFIVAEGGSGGWGNTHFKSPTNQAPRRANPGLPGERRSLSLELKLIADVGVIGFPNAGKSTLISSVSASKAKIGNFPFTTLEPNLGVVEWGENKNFVMADIPGLVEGAAEGKGLGHKFLRHVERCRILVHLIDPVAQEEERDPVKDFQAINRELARYSEELSKKQQVVVLNKIDAVEDGDLPEVLERLEKECGAFVFRISAVTKEGSAKLLNHLGAEVLKAKQESV